MKKPFRLTAALLVLCILAALLPAGARAGGETTVVVANGGNLRDAVEKAAPGSIIQLAGTGHVNVIGAEGDAPWRIDKALTIQGGTVDLRPGGILLGADVTFRDTSLDFSNAIRNAVMANGYTLTLDNVTCDNYSFNLFCGGLIDSNGEGLQIPAPGPAGTLVIRGGTSLQNNDYLGSGNLYAGNLSMGGMNGDHNGEDDNAPANVYTGSPVIRVESGGGSGALGSVYACGAQQRIPVGQQGGKITLPDPDAYTVSGTVTVSGDVPGVYGGGAAAVEVTYSGGGSLAQRLYREISSLHVQSGDLALKESSSLRAEAAVSLAQGAVLNIAGLGAAPQIASLTGGGSLVLGSGQTLDISGAVAGETTVAVGTLFNGYSDLPALGHVYIRAPGSTQDSFRLAPVAAGAVTWARDGEGAWSAAAAEVGDTAKLTTFRFAGDVTSVDDITDYVSMGLYAEYTEGETLYLEDIPFVITVNGTAAAIAKDAFGYTYTADGIEEMYVTSEPDLSVGVTTNDKRYEITITVPGDYTASGAPITATATLIAGEPPAPEHVHVWSTDWASDASHHWHNCTAADCDVSEDSQKDGYAAHTAGDWVIDQAATATEAGSKHRACAVCGYEMEREDIPATGSGSSGGPSGGGSSGGPSGGGGPTGGGSPSGGGAAGPVITTDNATGTVTVRTGSAQPVPVEIPMADPSMGVVAVLIDVGGGETVLRTSVATERGVVAAVPDGATVKLVDNSKYFADTANHWARSAIDFVSARELFAGQGDATFAPEGTMTRGMSMVVLARLSGADTEGGATWYEKGLSWAVEKGISDGTAPHALLTREQFVTMLYRSAGSPAVTNLALSFRDGDRVSAYARAAMCWAVERGLINGYSDGTLTPQGSITRSQAATLLTRYVYTVLAGREMPKV